MKIVILLLITFESLSQIISFQNYNLSKSRLGFHTLHDSHYCFLKKNIQQTELLANLYAYEPNQINQIGKMQIKISQDVQQNIQLRTSSFNSYKRSNNTFLIFSQNYVKQYYQNFNYSIELLNMDSKNKKIIQCFFSTNSTSQIIVISSNNHSNFTIQYRLQQILQKHVVMPISRSTSYFIRAVLNSSDIFLLFNTGICIYNDSSTLDLIQFIGFDTNGGLNTTMYSMDAIDDLLVYSIGSTVTVMSKSSSGFERVNQINFDAQIDDVRIFNRFLIILSDNKLSQFDLDIEITISQQNVSSDGWRFDILGSQLIVFYKDFPQAYNQFISYKLSNNCQYDGENCPQGYTVVNLTYCRKVMVINDNGYESSNSSNNSQMNSEPSQQNNYNSPQITISKVLTFSSFSLLPAVLRILFLFLDDLYYYKYHRVDYPTTIRLFMEKMQLFYKFRVKNWLLSLVDSIDQIDVEEEQQLYYNEFISEYPKNPDGLYFLNNIQDVYISNLLSNVFFFIIAKVIWFVLFILKVKFNICHKQLLWVNRNTKLWSLLTMIVEGNLMFLIFNCCLQLLILSSLNFNNKLNMLACIIVFFITFSYSTVFYQLIYHFEKRSSAQTILNFSNYSAKSFYFQSYTFLLRTTTRGILQAITFQYYYLQIITLFASDIVFSGMTIIFRNQFCHKIVFIFAFMYNFIFLIVDAMFLLHYKKTNLFQKYNYDTAIFVLFCFLFTVYLLLFLSVVVVNIYEVYYPTKPKIKQKIERIVQKKVNNMFKKTYRIKIIKNKSKNDINKKVTNQFSMVMIPVEKITSKRIENEWNNNELKHNNYMKRLSKDSMQQGIQSKGEKISIFQQYAAFLY